MKIHEALTAIKDTDLVLPEFQREYVWNRDQAKQLMISLLKSYPVGGILVWKTTSPPALKNVEKLPEGLGTVKVLLDGQQRLTTLHMLITGAIPAYYTEAEIENDPRDLCFNLLTQEFQYYQPSKMRDDPIWQKVTECFAADNRVNPIVIAQQKEKDPIECMKLAGALNNNLNALRNIQNADFPEQTVPSSADLGAAIDVFDRVNSQGTKLTDAELALTHVTAKWPDARRELKRVMYALEKKGFYFGLNFMTRALTTTVTGRALYETIHERSREEVVAGWLTLQKMFDYLLTLLPQRAFIHSTEDLNTDRALIPLIAYLRLNGGQFRSDKSIKSAINWLYLALTWARYTAQTDQRLEADVSIVAKTAEPWDALRELIVEQRGRVEFAAGDLEGRGAPHPLYRMVYILAKAHGAIDWFNGLPLASTHGHAYAIHSHHIFPQALLYKNGFNPDILVDRQAVNEIANRAFLTATSNIELSDKAPSAYLPAIEEKYPGALKRQFIPINPELWKLENYHEFLDERRRLIAIKLNEYLRGLTSEPEPVHTRPVKELVSLGESDVVEFKSTFQWDVVQGQQNTALRKSSLKTIAAFMNSFGGTLVIGVEDDQRPYGLENDLKLVGNSSDKFVQTIVNSIIDNIGPEFAHLYKIRVEDLDGVPVCVIDVQPSQKAVYVKGDKAGVLDFYVRASNTTRSLNMEEAHRYMEMREA